jgi:hypothetical protein
MAEWESSKYDFQNEHWSDLAEQWIPELSMNLGAEIGAQEKLGGAAHKET